MAHFSIKHSLTRRWHKYIIGGLLLHATGIAYADTKVLGVIEVQALNLTTQVKESDFTVSGDRTVYLCNAAASPITVTLLGVTSKDVKNRTYHIKKTDSSINKVTIDGLLSETIDGALTAVLENQFESVMLVSDGVSNWGIH